MYRSTYLFLFFLMLLSCAREEEQATAGFQLQPLPFHQVELEDTFWEPRLERQTEILVPFALDKTIPAVDNLAKAAKFLKGDTTEPPFPHRYISSDLYRGDGGCRLSADKSKGDSSGATNGQHH